MERWCCLLGLLAERSGGVHADQAGLASESAGPYEASRTGGEGLWVGGER